MRLKSAIVLISLLFMAVGEVNSATIYQWEDANGNVYFSDKPKKGAKKIKIREPQLFHGEKKTGGNIKLPSSTSPILKNRYAAFSIEQPSQNATIRNNQGIVPVLMHIDPPLKNGDQIVLMLDGKVVGKPGTSMFVNLSGVLRGAHLLTAKVVDPTGKVIKSADPIKFFMKRPRTNMIKKPVPLQFPNAIKTLHTPNALEALQSQYETIKLTPAV